MTELNELSKEELIQRLEKERSAFERMKRRQGKLGINFETPNNRRERGSEDWDEKIAFKVRDNVPILRERGEMTINFDESAPTHSLIKGDNFPALMTLLPEYKGRVDLIYIDPPYNTGNKDFIYNDSYIDKEDGYRHSLWLSFMARRLLLAKELLADDGVIFVSIDDNEQHRLRLLMDEVFGEGNFVAELVWQNKKGGGNNSNFVAVEHERILVFAKNKDETPFFSLPHSQKYLKRYKEEDNIGLFYWDTFQRQITKNHYSITCPDGTILEYDEDGNKLSWLRNEERFKKELKEGIIRIVKRGSNWSVQFKQYLNARRVPRSIITDKGQTSTGGKDLEKIMGSGIFSYPKPVSLIQHLVQSYPNPDAVILDFFAGSGTTGQAVAELNNEDGGSREVILITDSGKKGEENEDMSGSKKKDSQSEVDIAEEITYERMRRVLTGEDWADPDKSPGSLNQNLKFQEVQFIPKFVDRGDERIRKTDFELTMEIEDAMVEEGVEFEDAEVLASRLQNEWKKFAENEEGDLRRWD